MPDLEISQLTLTTDPDGLMVPGTRAGSNFQFDVGSIQTSIDDHIADTSGAHSGSAISFTPIGDLSATNVSDALEELDVEKAPIDPDGTFIGTIITSSQAQTVADNTSYFLGPYFSISPPTSAGAMKFTFPQTGIVKYAIICVRQATQGSGENIEIYLRFANTTDHLIKNNVQLDDFAANSSIQYLVTGLNIGVVAGSDYETKVVIPTLTTNGTNQIFSVTYFVYKTL